MAQATEFATGATASRPSPAHPGRARHWLTAMGNQAPVPAVWSAAYSRPCEASHAEPCKRRGGLWIPSGHS